MKKSILNVSFAVILATAVVACGKSKPGRSDAYRGDSDFCSDKFLNDVKKVADLNFDLGEEMDSGRLTEEQATEKFCKDALAFYRNYKNVECVNEKTKEKLKVTKENKEIKQVIEMCGE